MSSSRYDPLLNPRSIPGDAEREMDDAFDDDDGDVDASQSTPLMHFHSHSHSTGGPQPAVEPAPINTNSGPVGLYDFERDYEWAHPPPGSPPTPTSVAIPSNTIGNSNGFLPTGAIARPALPSSSSLFRSSWFRRLMPSKYQRLPSEEEGHSADGQPLVVVGAGRRLRGGGIENDGVFANVTAKPGAGIVVRNEHGDAYVVPEDVQATAPPSYATAQLDATPAYWENTVHAPSAALSETMLIDDLPTGTTLFFFLTAVISWMFHLPGFLLTYLLHRTHAARYGSQAGLGMTLIEWGLQAGKFNSNGSEVQDGTLFGNGGNGDDAASADMVSSMMSGGSGDMGGMMPTTTWGTDMPFPTSYPDGNGTYSTETELDTMTQRAWVSFVLLALGWVLFLISLVGFIRVKRYELSVLASRTPSSTTTVTATGTTISATPPTNVHRRTSGSVSGSTTTHHDVGQLRRNLEEVFGIFPVGNEDREEIATTRASLRIRERENEERERRRSLAAGAGAGAGEEPERELDAEEARRLERLLEEQRLTRNLRAAGLL